MNNGEKSYCAYSKRGKAKKMKINIIELRVGSGPDGVLLEQIQDYILNNIPEDTTVTINNLSTMPSNEEDHTVISEHLLSYMQTALSPEDYRKLGREVGDVKDITYAELYTVGKPLGRGGGGTLTQFLFDTLTSNTTVAIAAITGMTTVVKQLIDIYFSRNKHLSLTIKHGEDEITLTGYSKEDAEKISDDFFSEILKNKLLE